MLKKKITIYLAAGFVLMPAVYFFTPQTVDFIKWQLTKKEIKAAAASYPYQIGLTGIALIKCFTTGSPPVCSGGKLCATKDPATCASYVEVSGSPAGGMGSMALLSATAVSQAGLTQGGQMIAGGTSEVFMDSGVVAGPGGCYGC